MRISAILFAMVATCAAADPSDHILLWQKEGAVATASAGKYSLTVNLKSGEYLLKSESLVIGFALLQSSDGKSIAYQSRPSLDGPELLAYYREGLATKLSLESGHQIGERFATLDSNADGIADKIIKYIDGKPTEVRLIPKFNDLPLGGR